MTNAYTYNPPFSVAELFHDYVNENMTQTEIAKKWCVSQKVVFNALKKAGIKCRIARKRNQRLEANANWKGGVIFTKAIGKRSPFLDRGYRLIHLPNHPHAGKNGYVFEHIVVALKAANIERLEKGQCVHHINLRKDDNRPENLVICSYKEHQAMHTKLEELAVELLIDTGLISFQTSVGNYAKTENP